MSGFFLIYLVRFDDRDIKKTNIQPYIDIQYSKNEVFNMLHLYILSLFYRSDLCITGDFVYLKLLNKKTKTKLVHI